MSIKRTPLKSQRSAKRRVSAAKKRQKRIGRLVKVPFGEELALFIARVLLGQLKNGSDIEMIDGENMWDVPEIIDGEAESE